MDCLLNSMDQSYLSCVLVSAEFVSVNTPIYRRDLGRCKIEREGLLLKSEMFGKLKTN